MIHSTQKAINDKETAHYSLPLRGNKKEASAVMSWISLLLSTTAIMVLSPLNGNPYQAFYTVSVLSKNEIAALRSQ